MKKWSVATNSLTWKAVKTEWVALPLEHVCVFACAQVRGWVRFPNGTVAEEGIDLRFDVDDENDNPPVFARVPPAAVKESSPPGNTLFSATSTQYGIQILSS